MYSLTVFNLPSFKEEIQWPPCKNEGHRLANKKYKYFHEC